MQSGTSGTIATRRPRVLVIAEAANPEWVSVPLIGWSLAVALSEVADTHIVTHDRNREAFLRAGLVEDRDFTAIDSDAVARPLWKLSNVLRMGEGRGWTTVTAIEMLAYRYFERLLWQKFGPDLRAGRYDIVHRITPLSPTAVSPIAPKLAQERVPFVTGPVNGGVPWPKGFNSERQREREWLSYVRAIYKRMPGHRRMLESSNVILTGSLHTMSEIPANHQQKCIYIPENGIDPTRFNLVAAQPGTLPVRACYIGRLVPYKGADMLIEAAAPFLKDGRLTLDIVGDGPMMSNLKALTAKEGLVDAVRFHGWLEHRQVQDVAACCHILSSPSVREFGGGAVLEAMALGVVPVIVDYAGPGELIREGLGFKVRLGSRTDIIAAFRAQLAEIVRDPGVLAPMAARARACAHDHFTWATKAAQVCEVYDWVLGGRMDRPEPFAKTTLEVSYAN